MPDVYETVSASEAVRGLRSTVAARYRAWRLELSRSGCAAMGYRLTGAGVDHLCCKHVHGSWRAIVAFPADADEVWVVAVGEHLGEAELDIYRQLYAIAGLDTPPEGRRDKPSCCADDGSAPTLDADTVTALVERAHGVTRRRR